MAPLRVTASSEWTPCSVGWPASAAPRQHEDPHRWDYRGCDRHRRDLRATDFPVWPVDQDLINAFRPPSLALRSAPISSGATSSPGRSMRDASTWRSPSSRRSSASSLALWCDRRVLRRCGRPGRRAPRRSGHRFSVDRRDHRADRVPGEHDDEPLYRAYRDRMDAYARLSRGEVLAVKNLPYVSAAGFGYSPPVVFRHVLPNIVTPAGLFLVTDMVATVLLVTSLSYLASAPSRPRRSGAQSSRRLVHSSWRRGGSHCFPGLAIIVTGVGLAFLGDRLADLFARKLGDGTPSVSSLRASSLVFTASTLLTASRSTSSRERRSASSEKAARGRVSRSARSCMRYHRRQRSPAALSCSKGRTSPGRGDGSCSAYAGVRSA